MVTDEPKGPEPNLKEFNIKSLPSKKNNPAPIFTKENATLAQCIKILDWFHANRRNQSKIAQHFDPIHPNLKIKQPLVSTWMKDKAKWREDWVHGDGAWTAKCTCQTQATQHPRVTKMMDLWVSQAMADDLLLTSKVP